MNQRSRGVLLFSFNNEEIRYDKITKKCVEHIKMFWQLPVTVVSDKIIDGLDTLVIGTPECSNLVYRDYQKLMKYINTGKERSLELSPYDETILIDTDFYPCTRNILNVWNGKGVRMPIRAEYITGWELPHQLTNVGKDGLTMLWSTIICFDRSKLAYEFFDKWKHVLTWYRYYAMLHNFSPDLIRNDYAVSIAAHTLAQKYKVSLSEFVLPYTIPTAPATIAVDSLTPLTFNIDGTKVKYSYTDIHLMGKQSLEKLL